jgi:hypothetical protein
MTLAPGTQLRFCGGCRTAAYCSVGCQRAHWAAHKRVCNDVDELDKISRAQYKACKAGGGGSRKANFEVWGCTFKLLVSDLSD